MAIRWDEFPHKEIQLRIYARLRHNDVSRSAADAKRHILRRRLASLDTDDHKRFVQFEARVEHLRCTRDVCQEYVDSKGCRLRISEKTQRAYAKIRQDAPCRTHEANCELI